MHGGSDVVHVESDGVHGGNIGVHSGSDGVHGGSINLKPFESLQTDLSFAT